MITHKINIVIKAPAENDSIDSVVVKGEDFFVVGNGGSNPSIALFFLNFSFISCSFHLICSSFCINFLFESLAKCFALFIFVYALKMLLINGFAF